MLPGVEEAPLSASAVNSVSVVAKPPPGAACSVVPHATSPGASGPGDAASHVPFTGLDASSFTTTDDGVEGVIGLLIRSLTTPRFAIPFGVTGQLQQATICSSGEKV